MILSWCNVSTRWRKYSSWKVRLQNAMTRDSGREANVATDNIYRLRKIFNAALRAQPLPTNCLRRSLALHIFLKRHNVESRLRVGTKLANGRLHGHAWLEHAGVVLNDSETTLKEYTPFSKNNLQHIAFPR